MIEIIVVTAPWCAPCRQYKPLLTKTLGTHPLTIIDTDEQPQKAAELGVTTLPTTICMVDGQEIGRIEGAVPKKMLMDTLHVWGIPGH